MENDTVVLIIEDVTRKVDVEVEVQQVQDLITFYFSLADTNQLLAIDRS